MKIGEGETPCFWMEPTGRGRVILRRFTFSNEDTCAKGGGCDASKVKRGEHEIPWHTDDDGYVSMGLVPDKLVPAHSSSSWPRRCEKCDQPFPREAEWQSSWAEGYTRADNGEVVWARHWMGKDFAGALFDGRWLHGAGGTVHGVKESDDGIALVAVCPNGGQWVVDGKATGGGYWTRTGDPRKPETLSVTPSIQWGSPGAEGTYHGYLTNGVFTAHMG